MAATRLITMHQNKGMSVSASIGERLKYVQNNEKTEDGEYISAYACDPKTVDEEFVLSKEEYLRITGRKVKGDILAYQIRQSFKPGEVTPEEANAIGYETAMRFTKENHAFIVATHTDKEHIHNHVIYNSTTLDCTKKFRDFFLVGMALQRLSDQICLEHGLSVIKPRRYEEREKRTIYPWKKTKRSTVCENIDAALVRGPKNFAELLKLLSEAGYEIKPGANPSIRGKDQKRFIRFRSLGDGYTVEDLEKIISGDMQKNPNTAKWKNKESERRRFDLLVDIQKKLQEGMSAGYERWAKVFNLKQISQALLFLQENDIRDYATLAERADLSSRHFNELSKKIKASEKRLSEIVELRKHIINYSKTREIYVAYRKSGYSKKFYEAHREELTIHQAAKEVFGAFPQSKIPKVKELNEEYARVLSEKRKAYQEYRQAKKEMQDYLIAKKNIDAIIGDELEKCDQHEKEAPAK